MITINNEFQALWQLDEEVEERNIDGMWNMVKEAVITTCNVALGPQKDNMVWISAESIKKVEKKKEKKVALNSKSRESEGTNGVQESE